jgi:hypothetical protein
VVFLILKTGGLIMDGNIYEKMKVGILRSVQMRKFRGEDVKSIIQFLKKISDLVNDPQMKLFLFALMWVEAEKAGLLEKKEA